MSLLVPSDRSICIGEFMGCAFAYHVVSTKEETQPGQSDLRRVGVGCAWKFLPSDILIAMDGVVAFSCRDWAMLGSFLGDVRRHGWELFVPVIGSGIPMHSLRKS
jgi:hypothetical protein